MEHPALEKRYFEATALQRDDRLATAGRHAD
jgi:hypothetical protein